MKEVIIGIRLDGAVISRKMVISVGNGVLKVNHPNALTGNSTIPYKVVCVEARIGQYL